MTTPKSSSAPPASRPARPALTTEDYASLERSFISPDLANAAGLYRVPSIDGREIVGRSGGGDYAGIVFPYRWPGAKGDILHRLRLDHPPFENGKPQHKYLTAPRERNRLYLPPCDPKLLSDSSVPIVLTEGEKKCLALWRAARDSANGTGTPSFLPIALAGVWNFRGTIGTVTNAKGERTPEKGVIPDFDRLQWTGRKATIVFDSNAASNPSVNAARRELARQLTRRGAEVWIADLPEAPNVNGIDDYLGLFGLASGLEVLRHAHRYEWRKELMVSDTTGKPLGILANVITALRSAPEWCGVLAFDEFSQRVTTLRETPWGPVEIWTEQEDRLCADWMQHRGLRIGVNDAAAAVETIARDSHYHPVRAYLDALEWDGNGRLNDWLTLYLGAEPSDLIRAFGSKWLISAVVRIYKPGAKADHCLILEGKQGTYKSTAIRILGEPWFTDDVPDLGSKDAGFSTLGAWIIELPELDAISRAEMSRVKSFLSRPVDHFRPPYGKRYVDFPRQCVFAGTVNHSEYLRDETGGRRFWPVAVGVINLDALRRDRDQLLAEAVARYRRGEKWWLDSGLNEEAMKEQDARYMQDDWESPIAAWLKTSFGVLPHKTANVSTADVLKNALCKPTGDWQHKDTIRVGTILRRLGWEPGERKAGDERTRRYSPKPLKS
jgi:predicted P-loop ATPase